MENGEQFSWKTEYEESFSKLNQRLTCAPILSYPRTIGLFILDTDTSSYDIGAVLSQIQDGDEAVIAYASRTLSKSERNYCATKRELLALVTYVRYFRHYLTGNKFTIRIDHGSLRWLLNFKYPDGQIARWIKIMGVQL